MMKSHRNLEFFTPKKRINQVDVRVLTLILKNIKAI